MTSDFDPNNPEPIDNPQGDREIVDLIFGTLREFRQEMAPRLALDGMFVSTEQPLARGTHVRFRFLLPEDFILAQGDAVVAWRRTRSTHPDAEPGMGLRFSDVDEKSMDVINHLVEVQTPIGAVFDWRKGAGEFGTFEPNEFAGSFIPASEIQRDETAPTPEAPMTESRMPDASAASGVSIPAWLTKVEARRETDGETVADSATDETRGFSAPEPVGGVQEAFEVSLMAEDSEPDTTPLSEGPESTTDLSVTMAETEKGSRRRRLWPLAGIVVVLLAAGAAVVWWVFIRPHGPSTQKVHVSAEAEPTAPAVILVEEGEPETEPETVSDQPEPSEGTAQAAGEAPMAAVEEAQVPPQVVAAGPATRIIDVAAERSGDTTVIGIRGNGDFDDARLQVSMLRDPARVLVRVARIETFYRPSEVEVGSPEVLQVRIGYHPEDSPPKLYVVVDLADESMVVRETSVAGDTIRVAVGRE